MTGYYDIVLGLIPVSFIGGTAALTTVADMALSTAIPVAAVLSVLLIGHAMFVNAPVDVVAEEAEPAKSTPSTAAPPQAD
ncbi:hypothetical protein [Haloarchaeobius salinus]|uniref:hypothetical protein n=1 Tax=Haloarchaeobius salinus TaxID=1198298 RepID=UPI00210A7492|nr:hypothetical protein [Haloarchaeobius salinus]